MTEKKPLSLKSKRKPLTLTKKKPLGKGKPLTLAKTKSKVIGQRPVRQAMLGKKKRIVINTTASLAKAKAKKKALNLQRRKQKQQQQNKKTQPVLEKKIPPSEIRAKQLDTLLHERYPAWRNYEPLQLGIEKQLFQLISAEHLPYSKRVVQRVLKRHTQCRQYLNSLLHSASRVSLKNTIVSDVIDTEKDYAKNRLSQFNQ